MKIRERVGIVFVGLLLPFAFLLLPFFQAEATTRYAAVGGSGTACTNSATPCTFATAYGQLVSGDTLLLGNGTYTNAPLTPVSGTGESTRTEIACQNSQQCTLRASGNQVFIFNTGSYVTIRDIRLDLNAGQHGLLIQYQDAANFAHHIRVQRAEVFGGADSVSQSPVCLGAFAPPSGANGAIMAVEFLDNTIHDCGPTNTTPGTPPPTGVYIGSASGSTVSGNTIYHIFGEGIQVYNQSGFLGQNITITRNRIYNIVDEPGYPTTYTCNAALLIATVNATVVSNNVIYGSCRGISVYSDTTGVLIYSNSIYGNAHEGVEIRAGSTGTILRNNILFNNSPQISNSGSGTVPDHNYCNSGCSGTGTINSSTDPFANAGGGTFSLHATPNQAIDTGASLGSPYNTDFNLVARPQGSGWDIGAYEFVAAGGGAPSIAIATPTGNPTYSTTQSTITLSGTASDDVAVTAVTWACSACTPTSGTASGTTSWSTAAITLAAGTNTITVTASDGTLTTNDVLTVTKTSQTNQLVLALGMETGSGTTATDSSGLGNHGTFGSGVTWAGASNGRFGNALVFDGTGSITIPDANTLHLIDGMTLEAWVFPTAPLTTFKAVLAKTGSADHVYYLYAGSDVGYCSTNNAPLGGFSNNLANLFSCDSPGLSTNGWTHMALTYDSANIKIYRDGALRQTIPNTDNLIASTGVLQIGASQYGENFVGKLDEVRIYNYARSAAQILTESTTPVLGAAQVVKLGAPTSLKVDASTPLKLGQ